MRDIPHKPRSPLAAAKPSVHVSNGFDALRLFAAVLVIYGHSAYLTGHEPAGVLGSALSTIGVKIFFIISGFFISQSWLADPAPVRFAQRRGLRIWPALSCCIILTMMAGALLTTQTLRSYSTSGETWLYLRNLVFYPQYDLPGVFSDNTYPVAVNGSLWSLQVEVLMYVTVPFLIGKDRRTARVSVLLACVLAALLDVYYVQVFTGRMPARSGMSLQSTLDVAVYFQIGAAFAVFRLDRFGRPMIAMGMAFAAAVLLQRVGPAPGWMMEATLMLVLPWLIISLGKLHGRRLEPLFRKGDFSYGLYLYGFPIQQGLMLFFHNRLSTLENFILALPPTMLCAIGSWHLVEKQLLKFKPGRN